MTQISSNPGSLLLVGTGVQARGRWRADEDGGRKRRVEEGRGGQRTVGGHIAIEATARSLCIANETAGLIPVEDCQAVDSIRADHRSISSLA